METQTQQQQTKTAKKTTGTKLYFFYTTAAGENQLAEFDDKGQLDKFLDEHQVTPISLIRGRMRAFRNRLVLA